MIFNYELADFDRLYPQAEEHPRFKGKQPPVFLNGWHLIAFVDDFVSGVTVKKIRLHSRELALFRAKDGSFGLLEVRIRFFLFSSLIFVTGFLSAHGG